MGLADFGIMSSTSAQAVMYTARLYTAARQVQSISDNDSDSIDIMCADDNNEYDLFNVEDTTDDDFYTNLTVEDIDRVLMHVAK